MEVSAFLVYFFVGGLVLMRCDDAFCRTFVEELYVPPQITYDEEIDDLLDDYMNDYRRVYIEHPRIRLDGVYIAVCHYMCVHPPSTEYIYISFSSGRGTAC